MISDKFKLLKHNINQYILSWFAVGMCAGIIICFFRYEMMFLVLIFSLSLVLIKHIFFKHKLFYSKILLLGIFFGICCTYFHGFLIFHSSPRIKYGKVDFVGCVEKINKNNKCTVILYSIRDSSGTIQMCKNYKMILSSEKELVESSVISCSATVTPIYNVDSFSIRLFFDKVIGFGVIHSASLVSHSTNFVKNHVKDLVKKSFTKDDQSIIRPLLFGEPGGNEKLSETCKNLGISHLFAISGLHFTIFGGVFFLLGRWAIGPILYWLGMRLDLIFLGQIFAAIGVLYYLLMVNLSWSALRSALTSMIMILIFLSQKQLDGKKATIIALLVILSLWPHAILDIGFQLSFIAVLTLLHVPSHVLLSTFAVFVVTLPYLLYHFGTASLQPFIPNLICSPFFSLALMPLLGFGSIVQFVFPLPFLISKTIMIFLFLVNLCSKFLVFSMLHRISAVAIVLWSVGIGSWILIESPSFLVLFSCIALLFSLGKPKTQVLISYNRNDIGFYDNRILWVINPESFSSHAWENLLKPELVLPIAAKFKTEQGKYAFGAIEIELSSKKRFMSASVGENVILNQWEVVSKKKPVRIIIDGKKRKILRDL